MKAISLRPPWPYAIFHLGKNVENRTWRTAYRGPLLIHASKNWHQDGFDFLVSMTGKAIPGKEYHIYGALVGKVDLVDCVDRSGSRWFYGPWGWVLKGAKEFKCPVPYPGQLGLFDVEVPGLT